MTMTPAESAKALRKRAEDKAPSCKSFDFENMTPESMREVHELQVHQIELEMQNDELRQTQAALLESEERFRILSEELLKESVAREGAEQLLHAESLERLRISEELREKEHIFQQQSRLAAMGEMINNIAHQWRQPLNVLGMLVQQMRLFYGTAAFNETYLNTAVTKSMKQINHMSQTIDDFRYFFKPDKEKVEFSILGIVTKTVAMVADSFRNQQISVDLDGDVNLVAFGLVNEYSQVLLNILMNARDAFKERGADNARITITMGTEGEKVVVTIADNAGGIPQDIIEKIFDPYFTTKGPDKGTGIGLFMSKTIIEKNMNGKLTVRNNGDGAEFRIEV